MNLLSLLLFRLVSTHNSSVLLDEVIFPYHNYSLNTNNSSINISKYSYQYFNNYNSLWIDSDKFHNSEFNVDYTELYKHRNTSLRYKFIDENTNQLYFSNKFKLAYIDLDYYFNNKTKTLNIEWNNTNFNDNNSLYMDYYYDDIQITHSKFKKENISNRYRLNISNFINNYFVFEFDLIVKSNVYNIEERIKLDHNDLVKLLYGNKHSSKSICIDKYCNPLIKPEWQICKNNKIYKSVCYAVCSGEHIKSPNDINYCNITSVSSTTSSSSSVSSTSTSSSSVSSILDNNNKESHKLTKTELFLLILSLHLLIMAIILLIIYRFKQKSYSIDIINERPIYDNNEDLPDNNEVLNTNNITKDIKYIERKHDIELQINDTQNDKNTNDNNRIFTNEIYGTLL